MKKTFRALCYSLALTSLCTSADYLDIEDADFEHWDIQEEQVYYNENYWNWNNAGYWNPTDYNFPDISVNYGNVAYLGDNGTMTQLIHPKLSIGDTYILTVDIGNRSDYPFAEYTAGLRVNGTLIPFSIDLIPASGFFVTTTAQLTIDSNHQALIDSSAPVILEFKNNSTRRQVIIDNVSVELLEATPFDPTADNDGDGMPNGWEQYYGLNMDDNTDADGDLDQDGATNLEEYLAVTTPNDLTSYPQPEKNDTGSGSSTGAAGSLDWNDCESIELLVQNDTEATQSCSSDYSLVAYNCEISNRWYCKLVNPNSIYIHYKLSTSPTNAMNGSMKCCRIRD